MEFQRDQAIYLQIGELICEQIVTGQWPVGEKIPSVRELAISVEVNPNTVMRTYAYLQEQGIIQNKRGIGYFVAEEAPAQAQTFMKARFLSQDLPYLVKMMKLLKITFADLQNLLQEQAQKETP